MKEVKIAEKRLPVQETGSLSFNKTYNTAKRVSASAPDGLLSATDFIIVHVWHLT